LETRAAHGIGGKGDEDVSRRAELPIKFADNLG
jgi:hypothetical protein